MSEQVQRRRDIATNLASFVGAQGEFLVDLTNYRVQIHDGVTPGGWPAAKLAELVVEEQTRTAADAALQNSINSVNYAAETGIAQNTTAISNEVARAEFAETQLQGQINAKASASDLAANTQFANALYPPERPGDGYGFYTSQVGPTVFLAGNFPPIQSSLVQVGQEGSAANIAGPGYLVSREFYPIEPSRSYLARVALSVTQPGLGQAVVFGLFEYNAAKQMIGFAPIIIQSFTGLFPASGRQTAQSVVTRVLPVPTGDIGVDPSTRYVRLVVQNLDPYQYVGVEVMRWVDITDSQVFAPNVASLQAQIGQLASQLAALTGNFYTAASTKVADANYAALAANGGVELTALTANRTITLPPLASMSPMVPFPVADGSGAVNGTIVINVVPAGNDLFNGVSAANGGGITIQAKNGVVAPRAGSTSWLL